MKTVTLTHAREARRKETGVDLADFCLEGIGLSTIVAFSLSVAAR